MFCYGAEGWVAPPSPVSLTIRRKAQERLSGRTNVDLMKPMDKSPPPHAAAARNKIFDVHMGAPEELGGVSWRVKEEDAGPAFWAGLIRGRGMPRALHHCVTPGSKSSNGRRRREHQVLGGVRGSMRVGQRSAQLCPQRLGAILLRGRRWLPGRKKSSVRHSSQHVAPWENESYKPAAGGGSTPKPCGMRQNKIELPLGFLLFAIPRPASPRLSPRPRNLAQRG